MARKVKPLTDTETKQAKCSGQLILATAFLFMAF